MKQHLVIIHGDEWQQDHIAEPVQWAKTKVWVKEAWSSDAEGWEHDHCQICWWSLHKSEHAEHGVGYHNHDNDNWVCTECHDQFISKP